MEITPSGQTLGARITGIDLADPLSDADFRTILRALGAHGVLCFPQQTLSVDQLSAFGRRFGELEINVANAYHEPDHPEMMILSNMKRDGKQIGANDAGQGWHTDMSYSRTIAFANVLYAVQVPQRDGVALGATEFANMYAAYDDLPERLKSSLATATATHDFNKFWEEMRRRPGSTRPPLTDAQRRQKPPVSHPVFLTHPVSGRKVLYANPGYAVRIDGMAEDESAATLKILFEHQLQPRYRYVHRWAEHDVLIWDDICTLHQAWPDYGPDEHRLMQRCQVMADRVFDSSFVARAAALAMT